MPLTDDFIDSKQIIELTRIYAQTQLVAITPFKKSIY